MCEKGSPQAGCDGGIHCKYTGDDFHLWNLEENWLGMNICPLNILYKWLINNNTIYHDPFLSREENLIIKSLKQEEVQGGSGVYKETDRII